MQQNRKDHPTIVALRNSAVSRETRQHKPSLQELIDLAFQCGADDAACVSIDHSDLGEEREIIRKHIPWARSLLSLVCRMNREPIRSPARSMANLEFHHMTDVTNEVAHEIVRRLEGSGIRAVNPSVGFPMEMDQFPDRIWSFLTSLSQWLPDLERWGSTAT